MSTPGRTPRGRSKGFTLLELMVVMVVMSLVMAVAMPAFLGGGGRTEARTGVRTLVAALRTTRERAVTAQRSERLWVNVTERQFRVPGEQRTRELADGVGLELLTAQSELQDENVGWVRFFPDGTSTGARLTVSSGNARWLVDVDWLTGGVVVNEVDADTAEELAEEAGLSVWKGLGKQ